MTLPADGGDGGNPDGTVKVAPDVWNTSSHPVQTGNHESDDIKAAVLITLNDLMDALGAFSFVEGATNLASALSDFSANIELSLGCIAVDMAVVASGLQVAAKAFSALDGSLATMFKGLESQMSYFTTDTTLSYATVPTYAPLKTAGSSSGGGISFGHIWHDLTNWGSDVFHGTEHGLESIGAPGWVAIGVAGVAVGGYWLLVGAGGTAAAAAAG